MGWPRIRHKQATNNLLTCGLAIFFSCGYYFLFILLNIEGGRSQLFLSGSLVLIFN